MSKYIDANLLKKKINRIEEEVRKIRVSGTDKEAICAEAVSLCLKLKSIINSLQKEADLEKEIERCWQNWLLPPKDNPVEKISPRKEFAFYARHFYDLGKKSK